jgi:tetratricopeptide (TPR) repeat protein
MIVSRESAGRAFLPAVLLFMLVLVVYSPALRAGFIWDDDMFITQNETLRSADGLRIIWTEPAKNPHYYPLLMTLFWGMYQLWGDAPFGYHLVTILFHAGCATLLWRLLLAAGVRGAFVGALLFALHPVHVQSVAWATELKNTMSGFFYLAALLAWASEERLGRGRAYALCAVSFAASLLSKTTTVSLPLAVLFMELWKQGRVRRPTAWLLAGLVALAAAPVVVTLLLERSRNVPYVSSQFFFPEKLIVVGLSVWFYLGKLLWPHPLIMVYPYWQLDYTRWTEYLPLALLVASVPVLFAARRFAGRGLPLAWLFFILTLSPVPFMDVNFVLQHSFVADHFAYLPSLGMLAVAGAALATWFGGATPRVRYALACVPVLVLGGLSWRQVHHYEDQEALWRHTLAYNPTCPVAFNNLGLTLLEKGRVDDALEVMRKGIDAAPTMAKFHSNLALALRQKGDDVAAARAYNRALELDPSLYEARVELAMLHAKHGASDAAFAVLQVAAEQRPTLWEAQWNLGLGWLGMDQVAAADTCFRQAAGLRPHDEALRELVGVVLDRGDAAVSAMRDVFRASPSFVLRDPDALQPRLLLARALWRAGGQREADAVLDGLARREIRSAEILHELGVVSLERRRSADAAHFFERALAVDPSSVELMNNLAWVRATAPDADVLDPVAAVQLAERALSIAGRGDPALLDTLAAGYAAAGRFDEAVKTAEAAGSLARREGLAALAADLDSRAALYRSATPYVDTP